MKTTNTDKEEDEVHEEEERANVPISDEDLSIERGVYYALMFR